MNKLFIIGNGFDIAHGLETKYEHFHKYLLKNYCYEEGLIRIPESIILKDGDEEYNCNEVITILIDLISEAEENGENWSDIEKSLGLLDFNLYLESYDDIHDDLFKQSYVYEDISKNLYNCTIKIKDFFSEWINTVNVNNCIKKDKFVKLIDKKSDIFLNFNYTVVLEKIYDIKNVFHIHGIQGKRIIIGHGEKEVNYRCRYIGAENNIEQIYEQLRKNTDLIIKSCNFFKLDLKNIDEIYSYGFSFSDVDMPYIKEFCSKLDTKNITWFLSDFDSEDTRKIYISKIKRCGFKGKFRKFNI